VSTNNSVASNQTGNPACPKPHARSKVVKKEKEQTLTATFTEHSEVLSHESWISFCSRSSFTPLLQELICLHVQLADSTLCI
jgi:hypothetical protein